MKAPFWWKNPECNTAKALKPAAALYRLGGTLREKTARPPENPAPVICVGNAVAGGAGKTPCVILLARILQRLRVHAVAVSRGYGGAYKGVLQVDTDKHDAPLTGDEAQLLARELPVFLCRKRQQAIQAAAFLDPDVILCDDGMQNPHFSKEVTVLIENPEYLREDGLLFPAGPYRMPPAEARARADVIIRLYYNALPEAPATEESGVPVFSLLLEAQTGGHDLRLPYIAFAGIGNPEKFFDTLRGAGFTLEETRAFADHYPYTEKDCETLLQAAEAKNALLITTEKDRVRLPLAMRGRVRYLTAEPALSDEDGRRLSELLLPLIPRAPRIHTLETEE